MSATNRGTERNENDFYPTPKWCVDALMSKLIIPTEYIYLSALEPCIGEGAIADVIRPHFDELEWCELSKGRDFLGYDFEDRYFDFCITNPPFSLAEEFIAKSLDLCDVTVMLLRLNFLGGQKRYERFWSKKENQPTGVIVLPDRPSFTGSGKTDATEYAWFIWDKIGEQPTGIHWVRNPEKLNKNKNKGKKATS